MVTTVLLSAAALLCTLGAGHVNGAAVLDGGLIKVPGAVQELQQVGQDTPNSDGYGNFEDIKIVVFTPAKEVVYQIGDAPRLVETIDESRPTVIYFHGYIESRVSDSVQVVAKAFLQRGTHNFVLFDYGEYVQRPYVTALSNLPMVAQAVAAAVNDAVRAGLANETLWFVGHSLGGQLAGMLRKHLDFKPRRITGLDPAGPGFGIGVLPTLSPGDADFVDVIHSDAGFYGYYWSCGHVDFWPNAGRRFQPGCPITPTVENITMPLTPCDLCSHWRSWQFFAESLNRELAFPAVLCDSWTAFEHGDCPGNNTVHLGYRSEQTGLQGNFYLRTGEMSPYGLGRAGLAS